MKIWRTPHFRPRTHTGVTLIPLSFRLSPNLIHLSFRLRSPGNPTSREPNNQSIKLSSGKEVHVRRLQIRIVSHSLTYHVYLGIRLICRFCFFFLLPNHLDNVSMLCYTPRVCVYLFTGPNNQLIQRTQCIRGE